MNKREYYSEKTPRQRY